MAALRLVRDVPPGRPESHTKAWTATVMAIPFGRGLVALVALTILVVAGVMLVRAGRAALDPWLDVTQMSSRTRILTTVLVGLGLAARATVYTIVAGFLLLAAVQANPRVARGVTGTLRAVRLGRYGPPTLTVIGIGFVANGVLEMIRSYSGPRGGANTQPETVAAASATRNATPAHREDRIGRVVDPATTMVTLF